MRTSTLGRTTARSLWAGWAAIEPEIFEINPSFCKTDECGRLLAAVVNNADAAPLDRNVQSRKIIHAAPLLLNREMCGRDLVTPRLSAATDAVSLVKFAANRRASSGIGEQGADFSVPRSTDLLLEREASAESH